MDIIVCIKQVPDTTEVKINPETNTLVREGVPSIINPFDENAVEEALRLREKNGGKVTVITMRPQQAKEALKQVIAMGVDEVILVSDRAFAGSDTWATSYTLAQAIKKIGKFDLIFCGRQAIDGDTAQVGPQLAEFLMIPQVTYAQKVEIKDNEAIVERALENGYMVIKAKLPILLTTIKELNIPRYPNVGRIVDSFGQNKVKIWTNQDIGGEVSK